MRWPYVSDGDLECSADDVGGQGQIFLLSPFDLIFLIRSWNLGLFGELGCPCCDLLLNEILHSSWFFPISSVFSLWKFVMHTESSGYKRKPRKLKMWFMRNNFVSLKGALPGQSAGAIFLGSSVVR